MKKKLLTSGLALSVLLGGASLSSANAATPQAVEHDLQTKVVIEDGKAEPMFWAAVGRAAAKGVAWGAGWVVGEKAAKAVFGDTVIMDQDYEYEEVKESFDL